MADVNRRRFLRTAGATAAFTALSGSIERAAALPAQGRHGTIEDVGHIVVLMQENRSFDHYFGALRGVRGFGDPRPFVLGSGKPVWHQPDGAREVLPFRPDSDDLGMRFIAGLAHNWPDGQLARNNGRCDRWIPGKSVRTMAHLTREDIPFHYALADAFTVCDAYHCSFIGATDPNRYYLWSGHTGNDGRGGGPVLGNEEVGYDWTTYPERLERAGISWRIYQDIGDGLDAAGRWGWIKDAYRGNYGDNSLLYFNQYRTARPGSPLYDRARTGTDARRGEGYFDRLEADVLADTLPRISWIIAPEAFSEHPNWPVNYGAWYIARVLDALTANPEVWGRTALFVTYDENDGYFDHVPPPFAPASAAQGRSGVDAALENFPGGGKYGAGPYGLGPRVPTLAISPWSTGGYVCSETFDHTSLIRFMEARFGVAEPQISPWRRAVCGDLTSAFDFSLRRPRPVRLPDTDAYEPPDRERHPDYVPVPPADPAMPVQERGHRPARPLPYAPLVDGESAPDTGRFTLTFSGGPGAGACFIVTAADRDDGPWTYTTAAGGRISDTWNPVHPQDGYDLTVYGPNGFLRTFRGRNTTPGPEVTARHRASRGLELTFTNPTGTTRLLTLSEAYGGGRRTLAVRPGATVRHTVRLRGRRRWYDVTVVSRGDTRFLRRFAGHVENGTPGVSDPATVTG
ncbi:phospholipase C, phosphocholine-specific [Streptomyces sp. NPDC000594]|uniref:phosphocholine-specific phospholipase C n=1 Tax=Streptomyces sp. NPDC000594 TaxID=3154261 RepID=UPI00331B6581